MSSDNVVVVISNNADITEYISSKLVLLRDVDKIEYANTIDALNVIEDRIPNIIILHTESNDSRRKKLVSDIKSNKNLNRIPIILISEKCSPDYLVEMFDAGISDLISTPLKEYELLFRVMWNIQKSEEYAHNELQNKFLANLGIIQKGTGFYSEKYCEEFLTNQVDYVIEHKKPSCIMYMQVENLDGGESDQREFSKIIKKSIRLNDWVGIAGKNAYFIFFPKTKLNGTFSIFERLKRNSNYNYKITASVTEVFDKPFDKISEFLKNSIREDKDDAGSSLVVASDKVVKQNKANKVNVIDEEEINKAFNAVIRRNKDKLNIDIEPPKEQSVMDVIAKSSKEDVDTSDDIEVRNAIAFKQVYKSKCKIVIEPVFKKYKSLIESYSQYIFVEYKTDLEESYFKISKGANELILSMKYFGLSTVMIETTHIFNNRLKSSDKIEAEITKIDVKFMTFILEELLNSLETC